MPEILEKYSFEKYKNAFKDGDPNTGRNVYYKMLALRDLLIASDPSSIQSDKLPNVLKKFSDFDVNNRAFLEKAHEDLFEIGRAEGVNWSIFNITNEPPLTSGIRR